MRKSGIIKMKDVKEHLGFILTISVTYVIGILVILMQYLALEGEKSFMKEFLDSIIPTIITYVLGCVLVNVAEILKEKRDEYVYNLFGCIFVFVYLIMFNIYLLAGFSWFWMILELIFTSLLIWLNVMCYKEKYVGRNHSLT